MTLRTSEKPKQISHTKPTPSQLLDQRRDHKLVAYYSRFVACFRLRGKVYDFRGRE